eukprot:1565434-Pyramimonas_sp.AAC.1
MSVWSPYRRNRTLQLPFRANNLGWLEDASIGYLLHDLNVPEECATTSPYRCDTSPSMRATSPSRRAASPSR